VSCELTTGEVEFIDKTIADLKAENEQLEQEMMTRCGECDAMLDCDECLRADASQKAMRALRYENERLSGELDAEHALAETLGHSHEQVQAENAKLRKFACSLMGHVCRECTERVCEYENEFVTCTWMERARELGIEVDG